MESAKPPTSSSSMLLPILYLCLLHCGPSIGSPMANRELQMLEMMRNILGVDSPDLSGRSQRSSPMMFAASVPCEDSLPEDTSDSLNFFDEDLDDSEECSDFGRPCDGAKEAPSELEPCPRPLLPMDHPCFVRVIVLRTPLLRHDPCTNFTLVGQPQNTTTATPDTQPRTRKCKPKVKKAKPKPELRVANEDDNSTSTVSTTQTEPETTAILTTTTAEPELSTTSEEPSTTVELTTTEAPPTSTSTTTTTTTSTEIIPTRSKVKNQLKSLRGRRRKHGKKRPSVPDTPKIKLDGAMQSSVTLPVYHKTKVAELKTRPETATKTNVIETTTESSDCVEDTNEVESDSRVKADSETEETSSVSEDCEDAEDQDTNLCPQFSPPEEPANMRLSPATRYRKTVKNYVEPILYEGQFAKPRQRIGMLGPQRRDYYVSNKQIMPRPRPKYREPLPHSIYMNNIVRGLKCSDEVDGHGHPHGHPHAHPHTQPHPLPHANAHAHPHPVQPRRYRNGKPTAPQRIWMGRRPSPGYITVPGSQPPNHAHARGRGNPLYALSSGEDLDSYDHDSDQYYDDGSAERLPYSREQHSQALSPTLDPCQAEHRQERERERAREREREREREKELEHGSDREGEHHLDYAQSPPPRFFT